MLLKLSNTLTTDIPIKRRLLQYRETKANQALTQKLIDEIKSIEGQTGWQWQFEQAVLWYEGPDFEQFYPQIILTLKSILASSPENKPARLLLATTYENAGQLQMALETYQHALSRDPDNTAMIIATVTAMNNAKEYAKADEIVSRQN